jgi:methionyl aminopeptidase
MIHIKSPKEIELMRESGKLAAYILDEAVQFTKAGVSTEEINTLVHNLTIENGAIPAPLNYHGFPKSVCTSVNNVVTHGIPDDYVLKDGDIINIDVTCILKGYHGDTSRMVLVGDVDPDVIELVEVAYDSMMAAINIVKPGIFLNDIGSTIHDIADDYGFGVVREYCGHGVGRNFHEDPMVVHYRQKKRGPRLTEGMVFTIEPMLNLGTPNTKLLSDGWTVITQDGEPSAQWEHTVAVTKTGVEILTAYPR